MKMNREFKQEIFRVIMCNVCITIFLLSLLIIVGQQSYAQDVIEEWVARYNGPANNYDDAHAVTIDSSGNIYVTGVSWEAYATDSQSSDYATVSYDTAGNERWVARYNSPRNINSIDVAYAIVTDSSGNVYVTGYSFGLGPSVDYATVSYDSAGNERWVSRYINGGIARAITIDSSGNLYVTGTNGDYTTVSYDSSGNLRWAARYNGPANSFDDARAVVTDSFGNIYVTGYSYGFGSSADYATVSYDTAGNERWVARYNGPASSYDWARAVVTDSFGNIYVTGHSYGFGSSADYATVSYDTAGNERWVVRYNGPGNYHDVALDIGTDPFGNIYVTGLSAGVETGVDRATISYDFLGNQRWIARHRFLDDFYEDACIIAVDSLGNVYVTGASATTAYDSLGNQRWVTGYNGWARAITVNSSGNVYVTGTSNINERGDYTTIKYSQPLKLPLGSSIEGKADPGRFKVYIPSRYGGELTVSVVDSLTGFPAGNVEFFYPDFNTPIPSTQDTDSAPSIFKYEVPYDKFGWYLVKVAGSTNYTVSNTFIERGEVLPERKPWNISTWWPFSDVYDTGDSLSTSDDTYTISEIETLDDNIFPKYDAACGLTSIDSATYWESARSALADGHYLYNGEDRETHAEFDWKYDWNGVDGIENPGPYDFFSNAEGLFYSDGDLNDTYNSTWWGHCNGWANASIVFKDPIDLQFKNGFTPEDVKGLFTEVGMQETEETEEDAVYRKPAEDEAVWAKRFHDFLRRFIRDNKNAIWGNLKSTRRNREKVDEVWNHPIWYYEASMKERFPQEGSMPNERLIDIILSLKAADDLGGEVREDSPATGRPWKYHLLFNEIGEIDGTGSGWDTYAVDDPTTKCFIPYLIHPKFDPNVFIGQGDSNPYVIEDRIKTNVVYGEIRRPEW